MECTEVCALGMSLSHKSTDSLARKEEDGTESPGGGGGGFRTVKSLSQEQDRPEGG